MFTVWNQKSGPGIYPLFQEAQQRECSEPERLLPSKGVGGEREWCPTWNHKLVRTGRENRALSLSRQGGNGSLKKRGSFHSPFVSKIDTEYHVLGIQWARELTLLRTRDWHQWVAQIRMMGPRKKRHAVPWEPRMWGLTWSGKSAGAFLRESHRGKGRRMGRWQRDSMRVGLVATETVTCTRNWKQATVAREERVQVRIVQDTAAAVGASQAVESLSLEEPEAVGGL